MAYESVFKRYEKKYLIKDVQYESLKKVISDNMLEDKYGPHTICNLYFDTDTYEIIRRSMEKPLYKEKLRLRSYGVPRENDDIFFELKKKFNDQVFKRRIVTSEKNIKDYLKNGKSFNQGKQIFNEIDYFIQRYKPYPKIFIGYERVAYYSKSDKDLRITFDNHIRFRQYDLLLSQGDYGKRILKEDEMIMEIKAPGAIPLWLCRILSENKIYPFSFSKYGQCYANIKWVS